VVTVAAPTEAAPPGPVAPAPPAPARKPGRFSRASAGGSQLLEWIERRIGLTSSGLLVSFFAVFGWLLGRAIRSRALLLLVYGILIVLATSYAMGRRKLSVVAKRSQLPSRVREGQLVDVELGLQAKRRISTIVLEEVLDEQLGTSVRVPVPLLPSGEEVSHLYSFTPKLRGVYEVGPLVATWSDPFGLTRHRMTLTKPTKIVVHPNTEGVHDRVMTREWEDPPIRPPVSKPWPTGFEFYGMRDYVNGDDPRRIVWRKTAQTVDENGVGRYLVRESEQGITDRVVVILDTDTEYHSPGKVSDTFEMAVRAVASLGKQHLADGFSVTVERNTTRLAAELRGKRSQIPLFDEMAKVQRERAPLSQALDRLLTTSGRNAHYILVTPHLDRAVAARLRLLLQRQVSMLLVLVMWDGTDARTLHNAGALGCGVVELNAKVAMDRAFQRGVRMAARR
jgi:uncharacterized protein (DUF58 family)